MSVLFWFSSLRSTDRSSILNQRCKKKKKLSSLGSTWFPIRLFTFSTQCTLTERMNDSTIRSAETGRGCIPRDVISTKKRDNISLRETLMDFCEERSFVRVTKVEYFTLDSFTIIFLLFFSGNFGLE